MIVKTAKTMELLKGLGKLMETAGENSGNIAKLIALGLPVTMGVSAVENMIEPSTQTIGEYLNNVLVPGMATYNANAEGLREGNKEFLSKQLPNIAGKIEGVKAIMGNKDTQIAEAMQHLPEIMKKLEDDPYLAGVDTNKLEMLVKDAIKIAPITFSTNESLAASVIRAAALSGADSIDPQTAKTLLDIEQAASSLK